MNRQRDIERVLDAWFVDGTSRMPDRLFDAVLDEVGRMPQRRRPWSNRKVRPMSLQVRLAAAAAVIVLIGGAGLAFLNNRSADTNVGASPSVPPTPGAASGALPAELEHFFLAPRRTSIDVPPNQDRAIVSFIDGEFQFNDRLLPSSASAAAADQVRLVSTADSHGCAVGDAGFYTWTLSPGGTRLTLTLVDDACAARAAVVPGADWIRSDCPNPDNLCLGDLEAGAYSSQYIDPYVPLGRQWRARFGAITYTVPEGWANTSDFPTNYTLQQQGATDESGIYVYSEFAIIEDDEACTELPKPGIGRDATSMSTYLSGHDGLVASDPVATTIGGLDGFTMLLEIDPAWTRSCPFITEGTPIVPLFIDPDSEEGGMAHAIQPGSQMRVYLLDLGGERSLVIIIEGHGDASWQALIDEATSVVESMQFPG